MRSSQEIKDDAKSKYSVPPKEFLILEVLLDIRDILVKATKKSRAKRSVKNAT